MSDTTAADQSAAPVPCDECQAGVKLLHFITYFTWLGDELVMVPNFPAWICDVAVAGTTTRSPLRGSQCC